MIHGFTQSLTIYFNFPFYFEKDSITYLKGNASELIGVWIIKGKTKLRNDVKKKGYKSKEVGRSTDTGISQRRNKAKLKNLKL